MLDYFLEEPSTKPQPVGFTLRFLYGLNKKIDTLICKLKDFFQREKRDWSALIHLQPSVVQTKSEDSQ